MATIIESMEAGQQRCETRVSSRPVWWRQPHSAFFAALIFFNVAADCLVMSLADTSSVVLMLAIGVATAQPALLGLWTAFGGLNFPARFTIAAIASVGGSIAAEAGMDGSHFGDAFLMLTVIAGTIASATHALLLPLRSLLGWRIDFDPDYHSNQRGRRMQLRLADCIGFTTACALPLGLVTCSERELLPMAAGLAACAFFGVVPVALLLTATRRTSLAYWLAVASCGVLLIAEYFTIVDLLASIPVALLPFNLGLLTSVAVNIGSLRYFFGLRLFSVFPTAADAAVPPPDIRKLNDELALVVAAWADLPEATRGEILAMATSRRRP